MSKAPKTTPPPEQKPQQETAAERSKRLADEDRRAAAILDYEGQRQICEAMSLGRLFFTSKRRTRWPASVSLSNSAISSIVRFMFRLLSRMSRRFAGE